MAATSVPDDVPTSPEPTVIEPLLVVSRIPLPPEPSTSIDEALNATAELRIAMMGEATKDARARADVIGTAAGATVGNVRSANTGVVQITPRFSTEVSDYGMNDVTSIEKDITTVVKVTFALK